MMTHTMKIMAGLLAATTLTGCIEGVTPYNGAPTR